MLNKILKNIVVVHILFVTVAASSADIQCIGGNIIDEKENPVLREGIESSLIDDGEQCDMWYRTLRDKINYVYATDESFKKWINVQNSPVLIGYEFPYVIKEGNTYYMFAKEIEGNFYLFKSVNKTSWTIMNNGNAILVPSSNVSDWYYKIYNVGVCIIDGVWHMLIEGNDKDGIGINFHLGYSSSTLSELNWNKNITKAPVVNYSGNPYLVYVPERNAILTIHGDIASGIWKISATYAYLTSNLRLPQSWQRVPNFEISEEGIHIADPSIVISPPSSNNKRWGMIISYNYNQQDLHQAYADISLVNFFDVIRLGKGYISGKVVKSDRVTSVERALVELSQSGTIKHSILTDSNGNYSIALSTGNYRVKVIASGCMARFKRRIVIHPEKTTIVNFRLKTEKSSKCLK